MRRHFIVALFIVSSFITALIVPRNVECLGPADGILASFLTPKREPLTDEPTPTAQKSHEFMAVDAPIPYLRRGNPSNQFHALRRLVIEGAGFDFLAKCGDLMRTKNSRSSKLGVIHNSRHKCGDAFDYNQDDPRVLIVREQIDNRTYWRTWLVCDKQDGTLGTQAKLRTDNQGIVSGYVFDFTSAAESLGWERIPARRGWAWDRIGATKEYWHYEMPENLSFDEAIKFSAEY